MSTQTKPANGTGPETADTAADNGFHKADKEDVQLMEQKQRELVVGKERKQAKFFHDNEFAKLRAKDKVPLDFLQGFSFSDFSEGGGKGGSRMTKTKDGRFLVKEMSEGDHQSLLTRTKELVELMMSENTLVSKFYAHFRIGRDSFVVMSNCLPRGVTWTFLFDLKGNRDDKAMAMEGKDVPAVHKRCFSCFTCWYCCDNESCCCYPDSRRRYYRGKQLAFEANLSFSEAQATKLLKLLKADTDALQKLEVMDYSLLLAYVEEDEQKVQRGEVSEDFKRLMSQSEFVNVYNDKVRIYYMGIIDFLQEWNIKKDIARCIKTCAPHPLSTVPPPVYAEQFYENLTARLRGNAKEYKPVEKEGKEPEDVLESIEIKIGEGPQEPKMGEQEGLKGGEQKGGKVSTEEEKKLEPNADSENLQHLEVIKEIYEHVSKDPSILTEIKDPLKEVDDQVNPALFFDQKTIPEFQEWKEWIKKALQSDSVSSKKDFAQSIKFLVFKKISPEEYKKRVSLSEVPIDSAPKEAEADASADP
mmetsp:Transcript_16426/g.22918  ORF Transcript_16426/g.22918 Transcript_16426/m.22918 type:complete len:529 (-) Transcript_16426:405-1991(-)|eukprot:CAMPEP_0184484548 /NCGR_PEP_ID=MMETSP0113_2-20130426/6247_1 /TAXON_ID=91329 /ORGANISM="Norrisiella sphaerica, Strain BC52" /LENGTH=528 /DNA_ID=CAMNT_0026865575 /DNA_START=223 /DNA_END=1809 /DNA_ORIENTATION=+